MFLKDNFFIFLLFLSAFLLEAIGTYISIVGLSALFAGSVVVSLMMLAIDIGKVTSISFLYRWWGEINLPMKVYMTAAAAVLITITSTGAFGFLSGEFQKAMSGNSQNTVLIQSMTDEQARLQKRKEEIDKQIAQLPQNNVRGRTQLIRQFDPEVKRINTRLAEIDEKLPELKISTIEKNVKIGPILVVAESFNITPEQAVKWVILTIIFVFDPLAIAMLIAGNFLIEKRKKEKELSLPAAPPAEEKSEEFPEVLPELAPIVEEYVEPPPPPPPKKPRKKRTKKIVVTPAPATEPEKVVEKVVIKKSTPKPKIVTKKTDGKEVITLRKEPAPLKHSQLEDVREQADISDVASSSKASPTYEKD